MSQCFKTRRDNKFFIGKKPLRKHFDKNNKKGFKKKTFISDVTSYSIFYTYFSLFQLQHKKAIHASTDMFLPSCVYEVGRTLRWMCLVVCVLSAIMVAACMLVTLGRAMGALYGGCVTIACYLGYAMMFGSVISLIWKHYGCIL